MDYEINDLRRKIRMWKFYEMNEEIKFYEESAVITSDTVRYREIDTNLDNKTHKDETNTSKLTEKKTVYYIADYSLLEKPSQPERLHIYIYIVYIIIGRSKISKLNCERKMRKLVCRIQLSNLCQN